jgi:hypothetical protein
MTSRKRVINTPELNTSAAKAVDKAEELGNFLQHISL